MNYSNSAAGYLNLVLPLLAAVALYERRVLFRLGSGLALVLGVSALLLSQSRGGWAAALVCLALVLMRFAPALLRLPTFLLTAVVAAVLIFLTPLTATRLQGVSSAVTESRFALWGAAAALFKSSPVLGVGYGSYQVRYPEYFQVDFYFGTPTLQAHNLYLQILAETGLIGFLLLLAVIATGVVRSWRAHKLALLGDQRFVAAFCLGLTAAFLGVLTHGFVDVLFEASPQFASLFWLLIFLAAAMPRVVASAGRDTQKMASPEVHAELARLAV